MISEGVKAPIFCLPNESNEKVCLEDFKGKWIVLYFYPRDNTPGCTAEACDFTTRFEEFTGIDAVILGVSPDSPERHTRFIEKYNLKHTLLSDENKEVLNLYGAWRKKLMYGKELFGVIRSTVLVNPEGKVAKTWPKVKVKGHVDKVKAALDEFRK